MNASDFNPIHYGGKVERWEFQNVDIRLTNGSWIVRIDGKLKGAFPTPEIAVAWVIEQDTLSRLLKPTKEEKAELDRLLGPLPIQLVDTPPESV